MSLQNLQSALQQQVAKDGAISVSEATLNAAGLTPCPGFDKTVQSYLVLSGPLLVTTATIPAPVTNTLTVSGTASFLGLVSVPVRVTFTLETDQTVDALVVATLATNWIFSDSFPQLNAFPFTELSFTQPGYLLTTEAQTSYTWNSQTLTLQHGLNFISYLAMGGPLAILQKLISSLLPTDTIIFTGTIVPTASSDLSVCSPLISLTGTINATITGNTHFDLSVPQVLIISNQDENGNIAYWLSFSSTLNVNGSPFSSFQAAITKNSPNLSLAMLATTNPITIPEIINLIGKVDFTHYIPPELQKIFAAVGLAELGALINLDTLDVLALNGIISSTGPWPIGTFATINNMALNCAVISPFGKATTLVNFSASAQIFPKLKIFKGEFDFEITSSGSGLRINASYVGSVNLNDLVAGLSDNHIVIPKSFASITFENFGVSFISSGSDYNYALYGSAQGTFNISILNSPIEVTFEAYVDSASNSYTLIGGLTLANSFFQATANMAGTQLTLSASWSALNNDTLNIQDILSALGLKGPAIPPHLDLGLASASITYTTDSSTRSETFIVTADSVNYGKAIFISLPVNSTQQYFFLLGVKQTFNLSNLPLIGNELSKIENIEVGSIEVIIGSTIVPASAVTQINGQIPSGYPQLPATGTNGDFVLSAQVNFGDQPLSLMLSMGGTSSSGADGAKTTEVGTTGSGGSGSPVTSSGSSDGTTWFTVQKSFGPVSIQRIGAKYQSAQQSLWFEIDASLAMGPLTLTLTGLGIASSISDFSPSFSLQGMGISYTKPPLSIAGSFVNLDPPASPPGQIEFDGSVMIGAESFEFEAFGFYGNQTGAPSTFIFGVLAKSFGGPAAFFVTGVALGFGYNSALRLPTVDQVSAFPFVQVLPNSNPPNSGALPITTPQGALQTIMNTSPPWVTEQQGSLWFAAGITFTSFELVNSQALVIVEDGADLTIALLGTSQAQFPQDTGAGGPVYAYLALNLEVIFKPEDGIFSLQAILSLASFLLDRSCVLTGGFAFYIWFGNSPYAGDFVITLGGYNPGFVAPTYYPTVPALGFHWSLDSSITISGNAYLAFTPSVMMVGGELSAVYQSGNLKAWFDAHADIIVQWKPFWFDANIGISIGASYKVDLLFTSFTISVELGCDLQLWGPPTGGSVYVNWYIISFTIPFGANYNQGSQPLIWADVQAMLPNTGTAAQPNILAMTPTVGLTPSATSTTTGKPPATWIVRGSQFGFSTSSPIPATSATVGGTYVFSGSTFNVAPLGWTSVSATHAITIQDANSHDYSGSFNAVQIQGNLPSSLWGSPPSTTPGGSNQLVPGKIVGVTLQVNLPQIGGSAGAVNVGLYLEEAPLSLHGATLPIKVNAQPSGDIPVNSQNTISTIANTSGGIASSTIITARNAIFAALHALEYAPVTTNDPMKNFANDVGRAFNAEPLLVS